MRDSHNRQLREEFNQWAAEGRGEQMEEHHISIARQTIERMKLVPGDTVLDLGCGAGWASRLMAARVAPSLVVGVDVSDQMIARATAASIAVENLRFLTGSAEELPLDAGSIVKVLSIRDCGIATSGTYVRGEHIYNPTDSDQPITGILSLTVIGPDIYEADRFATAAFAMGPAGINFIEQLPGFEGYMIDPGGMATYTSGFERYVSHD